MESSFEHKHGDSFDYTGQVPLTFADGYFYTGWAASCKIKELDGTLVATATCTWSDSTSRFINLLVLDTSGWPIASLQFDIQFVRASDSYTVSTETVQFDLIQDITS